jgi:alpha-tubulin suppressor-like RCC1 family protein
MATYYWVGGAGTWNASLGYTTNWAASSGGAGGAGFPTSADNVIFDANSDAGGIFTVTVITANCNDITISGLDFTMTLAGSYGSSTLNIYGSIAFPATNLTITYTGAVTLAATTTGKTINTSGLTFPVYPGSFNVDGVGGGWTLASNFTTGNQFNLNAGTFNASTYTLNITYGVYFQGAGVKVLNMNSAIFNITGIGTYPWYNSSATNLTVNPGTSTLKLTGTSSMNLGQGWSSAPIQLYNLEVNFNTTNLSMDFTTQVTIQNNFTFNNPASGSTTNYLTLSTSTSSVGGTFSVSNTTSSRRIQLRSSVAGTQRTLSVATMSSVTNTDFKDIALTGTASPWTASFGTGNLGNNSGITWNTQTAYWIGGTGNWTDSAYWSLSSGGSTANGIPQSTNNVVFDGNSNTGTSPFTVTVNSGASGSAPYINCKDFSTSSLDGVMTLAPISYGTLNVYGSFTLPATNFVNGFTGVATLNFLSTSTGNIITTNGISLDCGVVFNGVGGGWTLGSNLTFGSLTVTAGTFNTGNYNLTSTGGRPDFYSTGSLVRAINLGSSTVLTYGMTISGSNLTFNAGTSQINLGATNSWGVGLPLTFYNFTMLGPMAPQSSNILNLAYTFNNLTLTAPTSAGTSTVSLSANIIINGTFSITGGGGTSTNRILVNSSVAATQRTITCNAISNFTNADFKDIVIAGTASPFVAPFGTGNSGNNSGITWNTQTAYWIGGTGNYSDGTHWSLTSGGSAVGGIPQDTNSVVFDANSDAGGIFTVTAPAGYVYCNDFTANNLDFAMTYTGVSAYLGVYGSLFFPATNFSYGVDGGSGTVFFATSTGKTVNTNGGGLSNVSFVGVGGGWTMQSMFSCNQFYITAGAIDFGSYGISVTANFVSQGTLTRSINLNTSTINTWAVTLSGSNCTFTCGTSTINLPGGASSFIGNGYTFYNVNFSGAADYTIYGTNTFNNLTFTSAANRENRYLFDSNQTINGTLTTTSTSAIKRIALMSSVQGTQRTLTAAAASLTDTDFSYIVGAGTATWSGTRIGDLAGNSGITFTAPKTVYLIYSTTEWYSCTWANTSGGATSSNNYPLSQDTMVIDNSTTTSSLYMTGIQNFGYTTPGMNLSSRTTTFSTTGNGILYKGNVALSSAMTGTGTYSFYGDGTQTLTTNGASLNGQIYYNGYGGTLQLQDNLTIVGAGIRQDRGTINLNSKIVNIASYWSPYNFTTNLAFGTATVNLTGTGTVWSMDYVPTTLTGTPNINITANTGVVTFAGSGITNYNKLTLGNGTGTTAQVTITGSNTFKEISSNRFGGYLLLTAGTSQQVDNFTYAGYKDTPYNIAGGFLSSTSTTSAKLTTPPTEYYGIFDSTLQNYLTIPSRLNIGTGDFTFECWYHSNSFNAENGGGTLFSAHGAPASGSTADWNSGSSDGMVISPSNMSGSISWTGGTNTGEWTHLAVVRSSLVAKVYINGVLAATGALTNNIDSNGATGIPLIGAFDFNPGYPRYRFFGKISNLRITNTVVYTANFTPPIGNLTAISGTQLLTLQNSAIVDNSTNAFTITNGNSVTTTQVTSYTRPFNTNYLKVSYVNVTPANTWNALNSLSVIGTNTGWSFSGYPGNYGYTDAGNPIENKYVTKDYVMDYYPDLIPGAKAPQGFTWGRNTSGQLGDGTTTARSSPGSIAGGGTWTSLTTGENSFAGIKTDGTLWTWGGNNYGQLGDGTTTARSSPGTTAGGGTNWKQAAVTFVYSTQNTMAAIKTDGTLWTWGGNAYGALGDGTTTARSSPGTTAGGGTNWKQVVCGLRMVAAIKTDGTLWTWGYNSTGQLGDGTTSTRSSPVTTAGGGTNWKQVASGYDAIGAIKTDGTLWVWGLNNAGQVGDGTVSARSSPVTTAGGGTNWKQVASGLQAIGAIKTDGTLWTWGVNDRGQLGDGTITSRRSPGTTAGGGTNWKQVSMGSEFSGAIKTDGTLWGWGMNNYGQLATGLTSPDRYSSPIQTVIAGTNWKQVMCGYTQAAAISEAQGW